MAYIGSSEDEDMDEVPAGCRHHGLLKVGNSHKRARKPKFVGLPEEQISVFRDAMIEANAVMKSAEMNMARARATLAAFGKAANLDDRCVGELFDAVHAIHTKVRLHIRDLKFLYRKNKSVGGRYDRMPDAIKEGN